MEVVGYIVGKGYSTLVSGVGSDYFTICVSNLGVLPLLLGIVLSVGNRAKIALSLSPLDFIHTFVEFAA